MYVDTTKIIVTNMYYLFHPSELHSQVKDVLWNFLMHKSQLYLLI